MFSFVCGHFKAKSDAWHEAVIQSDKKALI